MEFLVAVLAYVFATTNFLNLPRLILDNGGVAFVAAYGSALLALCLPVIVLELAIGQLTGRAPVAAFYNLSPAFKGLFFLKIFSTSRLSRLERDSSRIFRNRSLPDPLHHVGIGLYDSIPSYSRPLYL